MCHLTPPIYASCASLPLVTPVLESQACRIRKLSAKAGLAEGRHPRWGVRGVDRSWTFHFWHRQPEDSLGSARGLVSGLCDL